MEVVVGRHTGQSQGVDRMSGDAGALSECGVKTLMTPDHTAFLISNSGQGRTGFGRSSVEGLNTGRHYRAPVRCPCCIVGCTPRCSTDALLWQCWSSQICVVETILKAIITLLMLSLFDVWTKYSIENPYVIYGLRYPIFYISINKPNILVEQVVD